MPMNDDLSIVRETGTELNVRTLSMKPLYLLIPKKYAHKGVLQMFIE